MTTDPAAAEKFYRNVVGWTSAPSRVAQSLHPLQAQRRRAGGWPDEEAGGHEHAAVLGDVRGGAETRGSRRAHQASRRKRALGSD